MICLLNWFLIIIIISDSKEKYMEEKERIENEEKEENKQKKLFEKLKENGARVGNKVLKAGKEAYELAEENMPAILEKAGEAADKAKEVAVDVADWAEINADKAKAWVEAQGKANKLRKREYDLKTLRPIFESDVPSDYRNYPLLNIVKRDEQREKNEVCKGSCGFMTEAKDIDVLNVFLTSFEKYPITCIGGVEEGVYFANPYVPGEYIESNNYAKYMKEERVRELANIADCLGAKHVSISFHLSEMQTEEANAKLNLKNGKNKANFEAEKKLSNSLELNIDQVSNFKPHNNPTIPKLVYYKDDKTIKDLIDRRMRGAIVSNTYSVSYATVSMAKLKEAAKIDGAIRALKLGAEQSLSVCYDVENRIKMSYRIEFEQE